MRSAEHSESVPPADRERAARAFRLVAQDLERGVRSGALCRRIRGSADVIAQLSEHVVIPESAKEKPVDLWERCVLALAAAWQGADEGNPALTRALLEQLFAVWQAEPKREGERLPLKLTLVGLKDMFLHSGLLAAGPTDERIRELMAATSENRELMVQRIAEEEVCLSLLSMMESNSWWDERGGLLIRLPITKAEGIALLAERYRSLDCLQEVYFGGICVTFGDRQGRPRKAAVVFADSPPIVVEHERAHRDNPGLAVRKMGVGLNEALTEIQASTFFPRNAYRPVYRAEVSLVYSLGEKIGRKLLERYRRADMPTAKSLAFLLLDTLGPEKYLALYRALPTHHTEFKPALREQGYLPTAEVAHRLRLG